MVLISLSCAAKAVAPSVLRAPPAGLTTETKSPSDFEVNYVNPLIVPEGSEITLISANIEYSWYNISDKLGNNKIKINEVSADLSVI